MQHGAATTGSGKTFRTRVVSAGPLYVPSGRVEACDPFVTMGDAEVFPLPAGGYPVYVTMVDTSDDQDGSDEVEAYLSIKIADGKVFAVRGAESTRGLPSDGAYGVAVGAGTVAFVDHDAVERYMPKGADWHEELFDNGRDDSWFDLMDSDLHIEAGVANIRLPGASAENVVLCHSGWGDGVYPVLATYGASGELLGLHIQLIWLDDEDDEDDQQDEASANGTATENTEPPKRSWWTKVRDFLDVFFDWI